MQIENDAYRNSVKMKGDKIRMGLRGGSGILHRQGIVSGDLATWVEKEAVAREALQLGGSRGMLPQENFGFQTFWDRFWRNLERSNHGR